MLYSLLKHLYWESKCKHFEHKIVVPGDEQQGFIAANNTAGLSANHGPHTSR